MASGLASSTRGLSHASEIRRLLLEGISGVEIVRLLQCSKGTVSYHASKLGLGRQAKIYDWGAIQKFVSDGHSARECHTTFGISRQAVDEARRSGKIAFPAKKPVEFEPLRSHFERRASTGRVGELSEEAIAFSLMKAGFLVLRPIGNTARYDLVFEGSDGTFQKVQVKTGRISNGAIHITSHSLGRGGYRSSKSYFGEVDYLGIYCPANNEVYLLAMSVVGNLREVSLRVSKPANGQGNLRWATQYHLAEVAKKL